MRVWVGPSRMPDPPGRDRTLPSLPRCGCPSRPDPPSTPCGGPGGPPIVLLPSTDPLPSGRDAQTGPDGKTPSSGGKTREGRGYVSFATDPIPATANRQERTDRGIVGATALDSGMSGHAMPY